MDGPGLILEHKERLAMAKFIWSPPSACPSLIFSSVVLCSYLILMLASLGSSLLDSHSVPSLLSQNTLIPLSCENLQSINLPFLHLLLPSVANFSSYSLPVGDVQTSA